MGTCTQQAEAGRDSYLIGRSGQRLIPNTQRQMGTHIQQAKIDGDMYPTGRDRWGSNRQRQMGACTQQVETDGDMYLTGRDRRGHDPTGTQYVTCTQQVKTDTHEVETETGAQQQRQVGSSQHQ